MKWVGPVDLEYREHCDGNCKGRHSMEPGEIFRSGYIGNTGFGDAVVIARNLGADCQVKLRAVGDPTAGAG